MLTETFSEIYRDRDFVAVAKPANLLCVPGLSSPDNLFDQVKQRHPNARVIHRLDMATSGVVLFALHYEAQKAMSRLFEKRRVQKHYRAVVEGLLRSDSGEVSLPLICDWERRPRQRICWRRGKPALTRYQVESVDRRQRSTAVSLFPLTGRTHQLRVHMQALGHAILGDALYLSENSLSRCGRLMLHAQSLTFEQPLTGQKVHLKAPCPF